MENLSRLKRRFIPSGSVREMVWVNLIQAYRLYRRDGFQGLARYARVSLQGRQSLVPAWWMAAQLEDRDEKDWDRFSAWAQKDEAEGMVILYSGMPFVEALGQRGYWLAKAFLAQGLRVLFVYWRFNDQQEIPQSPELPNLYQMPMDRFWSQANRILACGRSWPGRKLFLAEMPHPSLFRIINLANAYGWYTAADQIDDWDAFKKAGQAGWHMPGFEEYLFTNVDAPLATSPILVEALQSRTGRTIHLLPNACEPESLNLTQVSRGLAKGQVTLGYFGHLSRAWFDWALVQELAQRHRDWIIYIIGSGEEVPLRLPENVHCLGEVPHDQLAGYAAAWDVALVPFKVMELTRAVDPIKVYEYLAMGLPVVAAGMPALQRLPFVWSAETPAGIEKAIFEALASPVDRRMVKDFLKSNTWQQRAARIWELLPERPGEWIKC